MTWEKRAGSSTILWTRHSGPEGTRSPFHDCLSGPYERNLKVKETSEMKKLLTLLFALAMTVSMSSFVVAQEGGSSGKETKKTEKKEKKADSQ